MSEVYLRPLTVGELLDKAFRIYRTRFSLLIGIVAAVLIPGAILELMGILFLGSVQVLATIPQGFLQLLGQVALVPAISSAYLSRDISFRSVYSAGSKRYWSVWGARFLMGLAIGVPFAVLLACSGLIPGVGLIMVIIALPFIVFLSTRWSLSMPAIITEKIGASEGLRRSWNLTDQYFWRVFGTSFAAGLLTMFLTYLPTLLAEYILTTFMDLSSQVVQLVSMSIGQAGLLISLPFSTAVIVLIYYDLRVRKEGFDFQLVVENLESPIENAPVGPVS